MAYRKLVFEQLAGAVRRMCSEMDAGPSSANKHHQRWKISFSPSNIAPRALKSEDFQGPRVLLNFLKNAPNIMCYHDLSEG